MAENFPGIRGNEKIPTSKGQRRMDLFQRRVSTMRQSQTDVNRMMAANYARAKRVEQEKLSNVYRSHFH